MPYTRMKATGIPDRAEEVAEKAMVGVVVAVAAAVVLVFQTHSSWTHTDQRIHAAVEAVEEAVVAQEEAEVFVLRATNQDIPIEIAQKIKPKTMRTLRTMFTPTNASLWVTMTTMVGGLTQEHPNI